MKRLLITLNMALTCSTWVAVMKSDALFFIPSTRALAVSEASSISFWYITLLCFSLTGGRREGGREGEGGGMEGGGREGEN